MEEYKKWSEVCKSLMDKDTNFYFKEREVWWCHCGKNVGQETEGKHDKFERPVLILKKINKSLFVGVPLTTKFSFESYKISVGLIADEQAYALIEQFRVMSIKRLIEKIEPISRRHFKHIRSIIKDSL
jgi:mRNA-degrading endonuclease toxin of MazEF toxin-antitoxin module